MTDVYSRTNELDAQTLNVVVDRLEYRARQPIFLKILEEYLDRIAPGTLNDVLDMGCGTGFVARQLGQRKDFHGRVLGVDLSPHLVEAATRFRVRRDCPRRSASVLETPARSIWPTQASMPCCRTHSSAMSTMPRPSFERPHASSGQVVSSWFSMATMGR